MIIGALSWSLGLLAGVVGWKLYKKLTNNTVVAYFPQALALYPGDKVQIMGVRVGAIDKIEPAGDKMQVTFHYENKYKVPANATASILNPSLVASRTIQLAPPYTGGPVMEDNAVIPIERTQVPVEWDDLRNPIDRHHHRLGPDTRAAQGAVRRRHRVLRRRAGGQGQADQHHAERLSEAITALNEGRGDFFGVVKSLALFVNALHKSDQQFVALNNNLAEFTGTFTHSDQESRRAQGSRPDC